MRRGRKKQRNSGFRPVVGANRPPACYLGPYNRPLFVTSRSSLVCLDHLCFFDFCLFMHKNRIWVEDVRSADRRYCALEPGFANLKAFVEQIFEKALATSLVRWMSNQEDSVQLSSRRAAPRQAGRRCTSR